MEFNISNRLEQRLLLNQEMILSLDILSLSNDNLIDLIKNEATNNPVVDVDLVIKQIDYNISKLGSIDTNVDITSFYSRSIKDFKESLIEELGFLKIESHIRKDCKRLIYSLNERGFLESEDYNFLFTNYFKNELYYNHIRNIVMNLYPYGFGATSLREYLLFQIESKNNTNSILKKIINDDLKELALGNFEGINKKYCISDSKEIFEKIKKLKPFPSYGLSNSEICEFVIPEGEIKVIKADLNNNSTTIEFKIYDYLSKIPFDEKIISQKNYIDSEYFKDCCKKINNLNYSIKKRKQTIYKVCKCIISKQYEHIVNNNIPLKKLTIDEISEELELNSSTISRTIQNKYLIFNNQPVALNYFIDSGIYNQGNISKAYIINIIKKIIYDENKSSPLSDSEIVRILGLRGISISRRTVCKYRESLGILSSFYRKNK